jgi:hypothetical protein
VADRWNRLTTRCDDARSQLLETRMREEEA